MARRRSKEKSVKSDGCLSQCALKLRYPKPRNPQWSPTDTGLPPRSCARAASGRGPPGGCRPTRTTTHILPPLLERAAGVPARAAAARPGRRPVVTVTARLPGCAAGAAAAAASSRGRHGTRGAMPQWQDRCGCLGAPPVAWALLPRCRTAAAVYRARVARTGLAAAHIGHDSHTARGNHLVRLSALTARTAVRRLSACGRPTASTHREASPDTMMNPNMGGLQPTVLLLREGTDTSQGKAQLVSNINAVQAVAEAVRTTLGPRGMDKLIHDGTKVGSGRCGTRFGRACGGAWGYSTHLCGTTDRLRGCAAPAAARDLATGHAASCPPLPHTRHPRPQLAGNHLQ